MTTTTTSTATTTTSTATQNPSLTNNGSALIFPLKTSPVSEYPMYTVVFGVAVFGHSSISDAKFQHVASVLAEWLDNDEDGCADIPLVVSKLTTTSPKPFTRAERDEGQGEMTSAQGDAFISAGFEPTTVTYNNELLPSCAGVAATDNCVDATLEEVLHMVTDKGYMPAFPSTFSTEVNSNSLLTAAMDVTRGGMHPATLHQPGTPTMMQHATTAVWQQNMCTGAYLHMWEALPEGRAALQMSGDSQPKPNSWPEMQNYQQCCRTLRATEHQVLLRMENTEHQPLVAVQLHLWSGVEAH